MVSKHHRAKNDDDNAIRIAVIRTEHLAQDWASVEAVSLKGNRNATVSFEKRNTSRQKIEDEYLSERAQRNLCDGLCEEIQIYKLLLQRAENLSRDDVEVSMQELKQTCPHEAAVERWPQRPDFQASQQLADI